MFEFIFGVTVHGQQKLIAVRARDAVSASSRVIAFAKREYGSQENMFAMLIGDSIERIPGDKRMKAG